MSNVEASCSQAARILLPECEDAGAPAAKSPSRTPSPSHPQGRTTGSAEPVARQRASRKTQYGAEKRAILAGIANTVRAHNQPPLDERLKSILVTAIGSLLKGGYDVELIQRVASAVALDYSDMRGYSRLLQLRMRVRAEQSQIDLAEHVRRKHDEREREPFDPRALEEVRRLRAAFRGGSL